MEGNRYWMIKRNDMDEIQDAAYEEAKAKHPKQRRRRFDEESAGIIKGIEAKGQLIEVDELTALKPVGVVYVHKYNLGTKKWADYRTDYARVYGAIEKETAACVKINGTWHKKEKIVGVVI